MRKLINMNENQISEFRKNVGKINEIVGKTILQSFIV